MDNIQKFVGFRGDGQSQRRFWETVKFLVSIGAIKISEGPKRGVPPLKAISERNKMEKLEQLKELYAEAVSKSEELMPGDFKQYFDEDFTDKMSEILRGNEYDN